jgi:hypothetical protein
LPSATRGALFEKTAPLDPPQKLLFNKKFLRGSRGQFFQKAPPGRRRHFDLKSFQFCFKIINRKETLGESMMNENIKMKTIGLVGGTGWVSSVEYYRIINETINKRLGGMNAAKCILYSFNYGEIDALNKRDDMKGVFALILDAARKITDAGADFIV